MFTITNKKINSPRLIRNLQVLQYYKPLEEKKVIHWINCKREDFIAIGFIDDELKYMDFNLYPEEEPTVRRQRKSIENIKEWMKMGHIILPFPKIVGFDLFLKLKKPNSIDLDNKRKPLEEYKINKDDQTKVFVNRIISVYNIGLAVIHEWYYLAYLISQLNDEDEIAISELAEAFSYLYYSLD